MGGQSSRSMNIFRSQHSTTPVNQTNDHHAEPTAKVDYTTAAVCIEKMKKFRKSGSSTPWLLHCSINIPHYPFQTEPRWLERVKVDSIPRPQWLAESMMHPADSYAVTAKGMAAQFTDSEIDMV